MTEAEKLEEYTVLNVEVELVSDLADIYVKEAKKRNIGEDELIASLLEEIAKDGIISALMDNIKDDITN